MKYNRTQIELECHPGRAAYALDTVRSRMTGNPRKHLFDGVVGRKGYSIERADAYQHTRPVCLAVRDVNDNGTIPAEVYAHLVSALRTLHNSPAKHPVFIRYDPRLNITDWDLQMRVVGDAGFIKQREAA